MNDILNILLADDTAMNLSLGVKLLTRRGHNVTTAEDGLQAFEAYKAGSYDVILMDVQMPVMGGIDSTREIRKYESEHPEKAPIPIIALTANTSEDDRQLYLNAGMNAMITKPFNIKTIVQDIKDVIESFQK
jgi:CheY-like chemotaxis protein